MQPFDPNPEPEPESSPNPELSPKAEPSPELEPYPAPCPDPEVSRSLREDVEKLCSEPLSFERLEQLREQYGDSYRIWRTENYWMATARISGVVPTEMEPTADKLEERLRHPEQQKGRKLI